MVEWAIGRAAAFGWRLALTLAGCYTVYNFEGRAPFGVVCISAACVILVTRVWARYEP